MKIYVLGLPDDNFPKGAARGYYRYVDILNELGYEAYMIHENPGFRCTWFDNETPIVYLKKAKTNSFLRRLLRQSKSKDNEQSIALQGGPDGCVQPEDFLIILTKFAEKLVQLAPGTQKLISNRGAYLTFPRARIMDRTSFPYFHPDVVGVLCVSEDNREYLQAAFPDVKIFRHHNSVNFNVFRFSAKKRKQICFMPSKNPYTAQQVLNMLTMRGVLKDVTVVPIVNKNENETAKIFRESLLFICTGSEEGCPNPPLEAMASGAIVVGYHGMGGREFFKPEFCFPAEVGHITKMAFDVEKVLNLYEENSDLLNEMRQSAAEYVTANYSRDVERKDISELWGTLTCDRGNRV